VAPQAAYGSFLAVNDAFNVNSRRAGQKPIDRNVSMYLQLVVTNHKKALQALSVLGDPTRRVIFERLAEKPLSVGKLSEGLPVSRSAVSQHLKILKEAGLVKDISEGTRRIYQLDCRGVAVMREWLERLWADALQNFVRSHEQKQNGSE
jgi:DNA-binding transcriptional ArsR family regulator